MTDLVEENALYILEIAEARANWDLSKEEDERKEIKDKVVALKLAYLMELGFPNDKETQEMAAYLAKKDLVANYNFVSTDFSIQ